MGGEKRKYNAILVLAVCVIAVSIIHLLEPQQQKAKLPTAERVGESVGRRAVPFAKGFARGLSEGKSDE